MRQVFGFPKRGSLSSALHPKAFLISSEGKRPWRFQAQNCQTTQCQTFPQTRLLLLCVLTFHNFSPAKDVYYIYHINNISNSYHFISIYSPFESNMFHQTTKTTTLFKFYIIHPYYGCLYTHYINIIYQLIINHC